jgi:geranylgeranylglycerol-phosphate geranylgeranyltransferase
MADTTTTTDGQKQRTYPKALLSIIRPQNCVIGGLTVIAGLAMAYRVHPVGPSIWEYLYMFILGYVTYFFVAAGGNVVNDIFDIEVDKINRPHRALPSGSMTVKQAWAYVVFLSLCGILFAWLNGPLGTLVVVFFEIVGYAYAAKVKALGLAGNFMVAFSFAFGVIYGSFLYAERVAFFTIPVPSWLFFLTAFMILQARETIKGAEDVEGDALRNVRTIARVYGSRAAVAVAAVLNIVGVACYMMVWILGYASSDLWFLLVLGSAVIIGAALFPLTGPSRKKRLVIGSTLDKVGALIGLIAFVIIPLYGVV